jgi:hypothetical protein
VRRGHAIGKGGEITGLADTLFLLYQSEEQSAEHATVQEPKQKIEKAFRNEVKSLVKLRHYLFRF